MNKTKQSELVEQYCIKHGIETSSLSLPSRRVEPSSLSLPSSRKLKQSELVEQYCKENGIEPSSLRMLKEIKEPKQPKQPKIKEPKQPKQPKIKEPKPKQPKQPKLKADSTVNKYCKANNINPDEFRKDLYKQAKTQKGREKDQIKVIEIETINLQIRRAKKLGLEATLTIDQWISTLNHFNWRCAYNTNHPYQALEHFMPITLGGGTTYKNVVPTCFSCNSLKSNKHPKNIKNIPQESIRIVKDYLESI